MGVRRDDNYKYTDTFWITGLISNMDNLANERIKQYVRRGRNTMIEGVIQEWKDDKGKPFNIVLAKLVRVELETNKYVEKRLLNRILKGQPDDR